MRVALLGTRGVPARYGGFETAVEEIGAGLAERGHDVTVYCRDATNPAETYRGMRRVTVPALRRRSLETLSHGGLSAAHTIRHRPDVALVFNAANAPWVAALRAARLAVALHIDGHDGRRSKWSGVGQRYYSVATRWGSRLADETVVDSAAIKQEMDALHGIDTTFLPYGARATTFTPAELASNLQQLDLVPGGYHLVVARFEPENQVRELLDGYVASAATEPLVVVGFAGYPGPYAEAIRASAARDPRIRLQGAVWDQPLLDALYAGAATYLHGHSVGGTNPSLLRAMVHGAPVLAYDCAYNRETTGGHALWFRAPDDIASALTRLDTHNLNSMAAKARARAEEHYTWPGVVEQYDALVHRLAGAVARSASPAPAA